MRREEESIYKDWEGIVLLVPSADHQSGIKPPSIHRPKTDGGLTVT